MADNVTINHPAEATAIADIARKSLEAQKITVADQVGLTAEVLILPDGRGGLAAHSIKKFVDEYADAPDRREGTARLGDLDSFIAHTRRFMDDDSAIFADRNPTAPSMTTVFDYHRIPTGEGEKRIDQPRFGKHRAVYSFPLSDEWQAWIKSNGVPMQQAAFAAFLEDRIADVLDPIGAAGELESTKKAMDALQVTFASPSRLLDLARGLTVRIESNVVNAQNLKSGESTLRFDTAHQDERGAPLDVPGAFLIGVPVFRGNDRFTICARLRYRIKPGEGKMTWHYDLYRAVETYDAAFTEACKTAAAKTELPLFMGTPEA
jgi:uncharacterized protein YfdQ (DUF2303 family)